MDLSKIIVTIDYLIRKVMEILDSLMLKMGITTTVAPETTTVEGETTTVAGV